MLTSRVEKAWQKKNTRPSPRAHKNHVEAAKEAFAFIHLLDLVEHMSEEIFELRQEVGILSQDEEGDDMQIFAAPQKKTYMN